jgi:DNA mismatch repair protein MLH3
MFNDPLSLEQCSDVARRLASCAFPFQCAHGRPSMVPLVHLGQDGGLGSAGLGPGHEPGELAGVLKDWKRRLQGKG